MMATVERGGGTPKEIAHTEQTKETLGHVVVVGGAGVEQMAAYFVGAGEVQTLTTPDQVREHFYTNPQVDVLITAIGIQGGSKKESMQGVELAAAVKDFYPDALTVLVASIRPAIENKKEYQFGFDYIVDRHILVEREKKAIEEGREEFRDFIALAIQARQKGIPLPENYYREVNKVVEKQELKLLAKVDEAKRKPTIDEALAVSMSTEEVPEDVIGKLRARKTG